MSGIGDLFADLQQRQAEALQTYQDTIAQSMKAWQEAFTPNAEGNEGGGASMFDPSKLVDNYFNFTTEMLKRQHEFTMKMVESIKLPNSGSN